MISRDQVKIELGITDTTYDDAIDAKIPQAEAKYREVAGNDFNFMFYATFADSESTFSPGGVDYSSAYGHAFINAYPEPDGAIWQLKYGDIVEGDGVPAGAYITSIDKKENQVTISDSFTADGDVITVTTNIAYYPVVSQIVWYMIGQQSTTAADSKEYKSRSVGPMAWTLDDSQINRSYGLPQKIVNAIPKYAGVY